MKTDPDLDVMFVQTTIIQVFFSICMILLVMLLSTIELPSSQVAIAVLRARHQSLLGDLTKCQNFNDAGVYYVCQPLPLEFTGTGEEEVLECK